VVKGGGSGPSARLAQVLGFHVTQRENYGGLESNLYIGLEHYQGLSCSSKSSGCVLFKYS